MHDPDDILDEAIDMVIHSGEELNLENLTLAVMTLKRKYKSMVLDKDAYDTSIL